MAAPLASSDAAAGSSDGPPEVALCIRCGIYPINSRKAIRDRSLCCNKCPDHGPWCTMHMAHHVCEHVRDGSKEGQRCVGRPKKEPTTKKLAKEKVVKRTPTKDASSVGDENVDETQGQTPHVEAALHRVEQKFQKKIDMESKRQEKRKKEVAKELKETQKRLRRHSLMRLNMRKRGKISIHESRKTRNSNPFFADAESETVGQNDSEAVPDTVNAIDDVELGGESIRDVDDVSGMDASALHSPENQDKQASGSARQKPGRRSHIKTVLREMNQVYDVIDHLKSGQNQKEARNDGAADDVEPDEGECEEADEKETEKPEDRRRRGEAALLRAKQLYKEIVEEREERHVQEKDERNLAVEAVSPKPRHERSKEDREERISAKRVVTPNGRYDAFDDETPRPQAKKVCGTSGASSSSGLFMVPALPAEKAAKEFGKETLEDLQAQVAAQQKADMEERVRQSRIRAEKEEAARKEAKEVSGSSDNRDQEVATRKPTAPRTLFDNLSRRAGGAMDKLRVTAQSRWK